MSQSFDSLNQQLLAALPELKQAIEDIQAGRTTEQEAYQKLNVFLLQNPHATKVFEDFAEQVQALPTELNPFNIPANPPPMVLTPEVGLPRMNPLYEAAIIERLQFDGDIPELRHGPLPEGVSPAVPVTVPTTNPVLIGLALETASTQILQEIQNLKEGYLLEADPKQHHDLTQLVQGIPEHPSYPTGQITPFLKVEGTDPLTLASLSTERKQEMSWKTLATSSGRRSALAVLATSLEDQLQEYAIVWKERDLVERTDVVAYAEWTMELVGGQRSHQQDFSYVDVAAKVLSTKLTRLLKDRQLTTAGVLEITPINTVEDRRVGWAARIVPD